MTDEKRKQMNGEEVVDGEMQEGQGLLDDPNVQRTLVEDPLFKFLQKWWEFILVLVAIAFVIPWGIRQFQEYRTNNLRQAADIFHNVRSEYDQVVSLKMQVAKAREDVQAKPADQKPEAEKKAGSLEQQLNESQAKLNQYIKALGDTKAPYTTIAELYRALVARAAGDTAAAEGILSALSWDSLKTDSPDRFYAELGGMLLARTYLDDAAQAGKGRDLLRQLAERGRFVQIEASLALAQISQTPEERQQALAILEKVESERPEQGSLLKPEIDRLKG